MVWYVGIGWVVTIIMFVLASIRTRNAPECAVAFMMMFPVWPLAVIAFVVNLLMSSPETPEQQEGEI